MASIFGSVLPRNTLTAAKRGGNGIAVSSRPSEAAQQVPDFVLGVMATQLAGLSDEEAAARLTDVRPNVVAEEHRNTKLKLFGKACANPLVILLL